MLTPKFLFCGPQCAESVELSVVAVGGVNGEIAMSRREMTVGCCSATVGAPPYSFLRCCFNWLGRSGSSKMHNATRVDWRRRRRRSNFGDFGRRKWGPWRSSWLMPFEMPLVHPLRRLPFNFCDNPSRIGRSRVDWTRRRRRSSFGELWAPRRGTWRSSWAMPFGMQGVCDLKMLRPRRRRFWSQKEALGEVLEGRDDRSEGWITYPSMWSTRVIYDCSFDSSSIQIRWLTEDLTQMKVGPYLEK